MASVDGDGDGTDSGDGFLQLVLVATGQVREADVSAVSAVLLEVTLALLSDKAGLNKCTSC